MIAIAVISCVLLAVYYAVEVAPFPLLTCGDASRHSRGEKSLRGFSRLVDLTQFDCLPWMTSEKEVWEVPTYLCGVKHSPIAPPAVIRHLNPMDRRLSGAGKFGMQT